MCHYIEVCLFVKRSQICLNTGFNICNNLGVILELNAMNAKFACCDHYFVVVIYEDNLVRLQTKPLASQGIDFLIGFS